MDASSYQITKQGYSAFMENPVSIATIGRGVGGNAVIIVFPAGTGERRGGGTF